MATFKYRILEDWIKSEIRNKTFQSGDKLPTEAQLSKKFGFSRQTVRAGLEHLISEGVLQSKQGSGTYIAETANLYPEAKTNPSARQTVSMIMMDSDSYIFPEIMNGATDTLSRSGYLLNTFFSNSNYDREREILLDILASPPGGLILEPMNPGFVSNNADLYEEIVKKIPSVFIHAPKNFPHPHVPLLDYEGASKMLDYLIELGHTDIGAILAANEATGQNRYLAFIDTMRRHKIDYSSDNIICAARDNLDTLFSGGRSLLLDHMLQNVSAVFCMDDRMAFKLINYLEASGRRVPEEISVVGYDDSFFSTLTHQITTVTHPKYSYGQSAARMLLELMAGRTLSMRDYTSYPELIVRQSAGRKGEATTSTNGNE